MKGEKQKEFRPPNHESIVVAQKIIELMKSNPRKTHSESVSVTVEAAKMIDELRESEYDSTLDTLRHIRRVRELMMDGVVELLSRAVNHDLSKLESPEKEYFDELTPRLKGTTYGSEEYRELLEKLKPALDHHYKRNSHHPEHYSHGIDSMDLFDIIEMFYDWKAASERHENGNIYKSIDHNRERFRMSDQLYNIFVNTALELGWD